MQTCSFGVVLFAAASLGYVSLRAQDFSQPKASAARTIPVKVVGLDPAHAQNLADGAVGLAAKRLSLNPTGASGVRLFQFASALDPTNENLLYLKALVGLGRPIDPAVIPVKVTDEQYVAYLLQLAKVQRPSYFRLLLYNMVSVLYPTHRTANVELQRARERGLVVDFDGVIKRLPNTFPLPPPPPPKPLLPAPTAKSLADGAAKLAGRKFQSEGRESSIGLNLMQFATAIDPVNENTLFIKALLLGNHPLQDVDVGVPEEAYFDNLKEIIQNSENETVKLLLYHLSLIKDQADRTAIVSLQKAKLKGKDIGFQALIDSLNQQTYAASSSIGNPNPGNTGVSIKGTPTLNERLKNSQLKDTLISRKWMLRSLRTQEEWFFDFRPIGAVTEARGTCKGRRGSKVHSWKNWEFRDSILVIDGYMKFKYVDRLRQWVQADGRKDMYLR